MSLEAKRVIIAVLSILFLCSLLLVQWMEVTRRRAELGLDETAVVVPASSKDCVDCHGKSNPGIVDHWKGSTHAHKGVGCVECHQADPKDVDAFLHYGKHIATIVTPLDCARCHPAETEEFARSHHAKGGDILASLDNYLAETVEGSRTPFNPHSPTPGAPEGKVNGMAAAFTGCQQCHGSKIGLQSTREGEVITVEDLKLDDKGKPTATDVLARIRKDENGKPLFNQSTWPNTGIGRLNLDGSKGSCSACHSRHDFSPRRARQPENCAKCHLGPDHPQKEIFEESKHGVAYRDLKDKMNLDAKTWVLGKDYSQAPTCATCHMSAHSRNDGKVSHDPGGRISWTNRPPISLRMDTDQDRKVITETDPDKRSKLIHDSWQAKRNRMKSVCTHCHTKDYVNAFYKQYDDFVILYNEKFAKPGAKIMKALYDNELLTYLVDKKGAKTSNFDEEIEWTWFYLWHHEGRRARHGASMMAPDYAHWHGTFEVAERFYKHLIPEAEHVIAQGEKNGKAEGAAKAREVLESILARPEHAWFREKKKGLKPKQE